MQIESTLTEQQITELFAAHAVRVRTMSKGEIPAVPMFRIVELFGRDIAEWVESQIGVLPGGSEGILSKSVAQAKSPYTEKLFYVAPLECFRSIAAEHNMRKLCSIMGTSEAAQQWEAIWNKRCNRLADARQEQPRKRRGNA